jgi:predicted nucleotidyltransferase/biotin operon repressor
MDNCKLKWTVLEIEIFNLLSLQAGERFSQREVAKLLDVSPTAVSKSIPALVEKQLVSIEKTKIAHYLFFNRQNKRAVQFKRVQNLKLLYESNFVDYLIEAFAGSTIILFGSFSRGEDIHTSDIDIAVVGRKPKIVDLSNYEKLFAKSINVNIYSSWNDIHEHLRNNILNGIILHGSVEL